MALRPQMVETMVPATLQEDDYVQENADETDEKNACTR
jgi:hypothetical protein